MTQVGPYRGRLDEPVSVDEWVRLLQRQRRWRRALPGIIACVALSPAVAIAVSAGDPPGSAPASYQREALLEVGAPTEDPWGLVVGPTRSGRFKLPGLGRPSLSESAIPAERIQAAVVARVPELRNCYMRSESYQAGRPGAVVASILIRKDGTVTVAVGRDGEFRRSGVSACVERTLSSLRFPAPDPDFGWVHLPLRFEP